MSISKCKNYFFRTFDLAKVIGWIRNVEVIAAEGNQIKLIPNLHSLQNQMSAEKQKL